VLAPRFRAVVREVRTMSPEELIAGRAALAMER
jgi:hypothetical protein